MALAHARSRNGDPTMKRKCDPPVENNPGDIDGALAAMNAEEQRDLVHHVIAELDRRHRLKSRS